MMKNEAPRPVQPGGVGDEVHDRRDRPLPVWRGWAAASGAARAAS